MSDGVGVCIGISLDRCEAYVVRAYESVNSAHVTKRAMSKGRGRRGEAKTGEITHYEDEGIERVGV